jgi:rhodanese-related sulfurtransferase
MPVWQFLGLDLLAAILYGGVWLGTGFVFSDFLAAITRGYAFLGDVVTWVAGAGAIAWIAYRIYLWRGARMQRPVRFITPLQLAAAPLDVMILDVRSHGYYDKDTQRIKGSQRLEPNALSELAANLPKDKEMVLYCTCYREATSLKVALELEDQGLTKVSVLEGGFTAWKDAGLPVETVPDHEVVLLPKFV